MDIQFATIIALFIAKEEINDLSHCCHELFPVLEMNINVGDAVRLPTKYIAPISVSIYEDNAVTDHLNI